eukprot:353783-Chlamydomonas_euryale.AAC.2
MAVTAEGFPAGERRGWLRRRGTAEARGRRRSCGGAGYAQRCTPRAMAGPAGNQFPEPAAARRQPSPARPQSTACKNGICLRLRSLNRRRIRPACRQGGSRCSSRLSCGTTGPEGRRRVCSPKACMLLASPAGPARAHIFRRRCATAIPTAHVSSSFSQAHRCLSIPPRAASCGAGVSHLGELQWRRRARRARCRSPRRSAARPSPSPGDTRGYEL